MVSSRTIPRAPIVLNRCICTGGIARQPQYHHGRCDTPLETTKLDVFSSEKEKFTSPPWLEVLIFLSWTAHQDLSMYHKVMFLLLICGVGIADARSLVQSQSLSMPSSSNPKAPDIFQVIVSRKIKYILYYNFLCKCWGVCFQVRVRLRVCGLDPALKTHFYLRTGVAGFKEH